MVVVHDLFVKIGFLFIISIGILYGVISFLPLFIDDLDKIKEKKFTDRRYRH